MSHSVFTRQRHLEAGALPALSERRSAVATVMVVPRVTRTDALIGGPDVLREYASQAVDEYRRRRPFTRPIVAARTALLAHLIAFGYPLGSISTDAATGVAIAILHVRLRTARAGVPDRAPATLLALLEQVGLAVGSLSEREARSMVEAIVTAYDEEPGL